MSVGKPQTDDRSGCDPRFDPDLEMAACRCGDLVGCQCCHECGAVHYKDCVCCRRCGGSGARYAGRSLLDCETCPSCKGTGLRAE